MNVIFFFFSFFLKEPLNSMISLRNSVICCKTVDLHLKSHLPPNFLSKLDCVQAISVIAIGPKFSACAYLQLNQFLMHASIDLAEMDTAAFDKPEWYVWVIIIQSSTEYLKEPSTIWIGYYLLTYCAEFIVLE